MSHIDVGRWLSRLGLVGAIGATAVAGVIALGEPTRAADHNDPRRVQEENAHNGDPAGDIADLFAWHDKAANRFVAIITWRVDPGYQLELDPQLRYGIHLDVDGDTGDDHHIYIQYGKHRTNGTWGMRVTGLPTTDGAVVGPVGETLEAGGARILSGLFDDPFFFDLDGFFNGLSKDGLGNDVLIANQGHELDMTRPFGFRNDNDTFAGTNVHGVVIEMPLSAIAVEDKGGYHPIHVWTESSRTKNRNHVPTPKGG